MEIDCLETADDVEQWLAQCSQAVAGSEDWASVFARLTAAATAPRCSCVWTGEHMAYRCKDCGLSDSSCMCVDCFDPALHEGHNYRLYRSTSGGCCDCGDPMAWRAAGFCARHTGDESAAETALAPQMRSRLEKHVRAVLLFLQQRIARAAGVYEELKRAREVDVPPPDPIVEKRCVAWLETIAQVCDSFRNTICRALVEGHQMAAICGAPTHDVAPPYAAPSWDAPSRAAGAAAGVASSDSTEAYADVDYADVDADVPASPATPATVPTAIARGEDGSLPPSPTCVLDALVRYGACVHGDLQDAIAMLQLELLFNSAYKRVYTDSFALYYGHTIRIFTESDARTQSGESIQKGLQRSLDRIFCQLFHSAETVLELIAKVRVPRSCSTVARCASRACRSAPLTRSTSVLPPPLPLFPHALAPSNSPARPRIRAPRSPARLTPADGGFRDGDLGHFARRGPRPPRCNCGPGAPLNHKAHVLPARC